MARNIIADSYDRESNRKEAELTTEGMEAALFTPSPADVYAFQQLKDCLQKKSFGNDIRTQAFLLTLAGESPKSIADVIGKPKSTVQSWNPAAQKALTQCVGERNMKLAIANSAIDN